MPSTTTTRRRILLLSSSTVHGHGYLDHAESALKSLLDHALADGPARLLFVPYALADRDAYAARARRRFAALGITVDSIHEAPDPVRAVANARAIFVGGGNTFRLLKTLADLDLLTAIRDRVSAFVPYIGASAGSNIAGPTIKTTNDMPIVELRSFSSLALVPFQINPHYIDPDPTSRHMGETRAERLAQFHEENDTPVLALREGTMLSVDGERYEIIGTESARLFRRGEAAIELAPGSEL